MGCDFFADEDGEFKLELRLHDNITHKPPSDVLQIVHITGLRPNEPIAMDLIVGIWR
jgi:hypothetical protein